MALILNIDTATEKGHISFSGDGALLHCLTNETQKDHASFLQAGILQLTRMSGIKLAEVDAVAVTAGPGSYTGIRVGMASAKGLCYALQKPLITLNTLEVLTQSALISLSFEEENLLFCPMIDARRMEVFTALYDNDLNLHFHPSPVILTEKSFEKELNQTNILFFGDGAVKWKAVCKHLNAAFADVSILPEGMINLSNKLFLTSCFSELAYSEPFYLKEFQTVIKM